MPGGTFGNFCLSLLNPPNEEYLNEVAFLLSVGEQAPFKDATAIDELTPSQRDFWVKKLSDLYRQQREEMERAQTKQRSSHR